MKKIDKFLIILLIAYVLTISFMIKNAEAKRKLITTAPTDPLTEEQRVWMNALRWCESNGNDKNINPNDKDNTPSWGRYQFKPGTFTYYQKMYGIQGQLMDGEAQEKIVEQMIVRGGIKWRNEFPDCTRKLGYPPKAPTQRLTTNNKGI